MVNKSCVVTQENTAGYSDEVSQHGVGVSTDFRDPAESRRRILDTLQFIASNPIYPDVDASWKVRMLEWLSVIERFTLRNNNTV